MQRTEQMVNTTLFISAVFCSALHTVAILWYQPPIPYALFLGSACATSMWNHGTTSTVAKWCDRAVMWAGIPLTFLLAPTPALQTLTLSLVPVYAIAKRIDCVPAHMIAHLLITFINLQNLASIR